MIFKVSSNNTSTANGGFGKQEIRMQHHFCFQARKVESLGINHLGIGIDPVSEGSVVAFSFSRSCLIFIRLIFRATNQKRKKKIKR